jgi:phage/plasmid primase-like uncharacterized protein
VLVTFDAGILLAVEACIWGPHIIANDNDQQREREFDASGKPKPNVGKLAASAAVGGITVPEFAADKPTLSDWNDKVAAVGIDEARAQFRRAMQMAERRQRDGRGC